MKNTQYESFYALRGSDKTALSVAEKQLNDLTPSSEFLQKTADRYKAGAKAFGAIGEVSKVFDLTGATKTAARAAAAVSQAYGMFLEKWAEEVRQKEERLKQRARLERNMIDGADKQYKDFRQKLERGEYRDPPNNERLKEISQIA